jgi:hypothetical protein
MNDQPHGQRLLGQKAEAALKEAVRKVVEEARRTGATLAVWERGRVVKLRADQLPPPPDGNK